MKYFVGVEILTVVTMKSAIFWAAVVAVVRTTHHNNPEECILHGIS
jgi:hypothetical protein